MLAGTVGHKKVHTQIISVFYLGALRVGKGMACLLLPGGALVHFVLVIHGQPSGVVHRLAVWG